MLRYAMIESTNRILRRFGLEVNRAGPIETLNGKVELMRGTVPRHPKPYRRTAT